MRLLPAAILISATLAAVLVLACSDDPDDEPAATATAAEVAATATLAPQATPTAIATPVPGLTPAAGTTPATLVLDPAPRQTPVVTQKTLGAFTPSTLPVPDRMDTVVYEVATNTATNLGPGTIGQFSPDGKLMVYSTLAGNNPTEVYLYDLATKEKRALALGRDPRFMGNDRVVFFTGATERTAIDLNTGQQTLLATDVVFPDFSVFDIPGGTYRLRTLPTQPNALTDRLSYAVEEVASDKQVLRFDATQAQPAGVDEVLVATVSAGQATEPTMNLYLVNVKTGAHTYVAMMGWTVANFPIAATANFVAWTDQFCNFQAPGRTHIYDRRSRTITQLDRSFWVRLAPDGQLAVGEFGGKSLIDLTTLRANFVIPGTEAFDRGRDVNWTADYKFASTGFSGGHGGLCG